MWFQKAVSFLGCELTSRSCSLNRAHVVMDYKWQKSLALLSMFSVSLLSHNTVFSEVAGDLCHFGFGLSNVCKIVRPINCKVVLELTVACALNP